MDSTQSILELSGLALSFWCIGMAFGVSMKLYRRVFNAAD